MTPRERYEALAQQWQAGGYSLIALRCWSYSTGAKAEWLSEQLREFLQASEAAQRRDWLDVYFAEQECCRGCGESYWFENVSFCTACGRTWCYRCKSGNALAANGNVACPCGSGEVVG